MSSEDNKHFVKCFLTWLKRQVRERNFSADEVESLEVATQCLESVYDVPTEAEAEGAAGGTATEQSTDAATQVYPDLDLFEMFQSACVDVSTDRKERAEKVKNEGNRMMKDSKYNEALLAYNKAISLDATNATFYCNRAAAFIRLNEYEKAISDCRLALVYNPRYGKAYGRMGIAYSQLGAYDDACDAYVNALRLEPNNEDYRNNLRIAQNQVENLGMQLINQLTAEVPQLGNIVTGMLRNDPQMARQSCEVASLFFSNVASQFPDQLNDIQTHLSEFLNVSDAQDSAASSANASDPSGTDNAGEQQQQPPPSGDGGSSGSANA